MRKECAWCGADLDSASDMRSDFPISHGICASCERGLVGSLGMSLERFLNSLPEPVMLVDVELGGRVASANESVARATGKKSPELQDQLLGDVFECANASLPGGCGRTIHCSGCTIRRAVEDTWATGLSRVRIPATLRSDGGEERVEMVISTERVADRVLLRVDRLERG